MKGSWLAASVAAIGLAAAVSACGGSASTTQSSSAPLTSPSASATSPASRPPVVPAGYQRIGGAAQGVSLALPSSWVAVNFPEPSLQGAIKKVGLPGGRPATGTPALPGPQKQHPPYPRRAHSQASCP